MPHVYYTVLKNFTFSILLCFLHSAPPDVRCGKGFSPLMDTLKPHSKAPLYSNTVIGTLAVDGWAVTFGTARRGLCGAAIPPSPLLAFPNVTAHPSTVSVPTSYHSMWHYN